MKAAVAKVLTDLRSYTYSEKLFILFVMLCSICITFEHSIAKPVSYSVFISYFSSAAFPYAWLIMMPINFFVVMLYNRFLPRLGCLKTTKISVAIIVVFNLICSFYLSSSSTLSFVHFMWKDIYVLLMFQQLWSVVHSSIASNRAKYLYGVIYAVGGIGSVIGSCIPGFLATKTGSEILLLAACFVYLIFIVFYAQMLKTREKIHPQTELPQELSIKNAAGGFQLITQSRHLRFILAIVILMQLASTFIDFEFNSHLEKLIPYKDVRTEYTGKVFGVIHTVNIFLQLVGAFSVMHLLGMKKSHLFIPLLFACNILGFILFPVFGIITLCFSMIKAFDYSIFSIIKEMLYVPLKVEEKFKAKAVIDVFAYRSSKALASLAILSLQLLHCTSMISWVLLATFVVWTGVVFYMCKKAYFQTA
jgi:ATP:ADP antiporter, AAA family